ncbi:hypothetical protein WG915_10980 [Corynebacterium sp. H128]|uniref:hypothetical protein n=1 Tax=unclassified Corynebacterium TaxID=2624378 RepID=UPI0030AFA7C8
MIKNIPEISTLRFIDPFLYTDPLHVPIANRPLTFAVCASAKDADLHSLMSAIMNFRLLSRPEFQLRTQEEICGAISLETPDLKSMWDHITLGERPTLRRRGKDWEVALTCAYQERPFTIALVDGNRHPLAT